MSREQAISDHVTPMQSCVICGREKRDGILVYKGWVCAACEAEIVQTDVKDAKYDFFIQQLRQVWYK